MVDVPRYVSLLTSDAFEKAKIAEWLSCVRENAPSGVVSTIQMKDDRGNLKSVKLIRREAGKKNAYLVPVSRDLSASEVGKIVSAFADQNPDLDFDVETNVRFSGAENESSITQDQSRYMEICKSVAKHKHEAWMKERGEAGWRYGPTFSMTKKEHPLLMPWDQLPDRHKAPDMELPQKIIRVLADHGFAVISKDELSEIIKAAN